jgi:large subunit ribosomal protein L33
MAKSKRGLIKLKSSESDTYYYSQKNSLNTTERIELKKYDPVLRKHVPFKETK